MNGLALCAGVGGLELGLDIATGGKARVMCYVEREAFCAAILAARMEDKNLAPALVWSDLRTFDGKRFRGIVDYVSAGFPCQPFSLAGKRGGTSDPRHLWPDVLRIIAEAQPGIVFLENVPGLLSVRCPDGRFAAELVLHDLRELGYKSTAGLYSAAEVGAPHKRERLFILGVAHPGSTRANPRPESVRIRNDSAGESGGGDVDDPAGTRRDGTGERSAAVQRGGERLPREGCGDLADPQRPESRQGEQGEQGEQRVRRGGFADGGDGLSHPRSERPQGQCPYGPAAGAVGRGDGALADTTGWRRRIGEPERGADRGATDRGAGDGLGIFPPGPGDRAAWERILAVRPDLAPAVVGEVRDLADGTSSGLGGLRTPRLDQLRALGNGVVPQCAALAFVSLWACLREEN